MKISMHERALLDRGLARWYRGRLIPVMKGGDETATEPTLEEAMALVKQLKDAVSDMQSGKIDKEEVERIAAQAVAASKRPNPTGFVPDDELDEGTLRQQRGKLARLSGMQRELFMITATPRQLAPMLRKPSEDIKHFQQAHDDLILLAAMTNKRPDAYHELDFFHDQYLPARQAVDPAMDTKTVGQGKELVAPPEMSTQIIDRLEGSLQVLGLFPTVTMPTDPFKFPTKGPRRHVAILAEALDVGTPKAKKLIPGMPSTIELNAAKFAGEIVTSKELEEDAAIAILPFLQAELLDWLQFDLEDATINGDTSSTHMDLDVVDGDDYRKGWDGLRASAPAGAKLDIAGALTVDKVAALRAKMARYGLNPSQIVLLVSVPSLYGLITDDKVTTVDKYGPNATLFSGELGRIWGIPIIASDQIRTDLDATGVHGASGNTKTEAIIVHRQAMIHGIRRNTTIQVLRELYAESDQDAVLVTTRQALTPRWPGEPAIAVGYNVT